MEVNEQTLSTLRELLVGIMSPDNKTRTQAEAYLNDSQRTTGFSNLLFHLITGLCTATAPQEISIRQSAAVVRKKGCSL